MRAPERIGLYRVVGELGQGAMGTVYLGRDEGLDREVALKVMTKGVGSADDRARFLREGRAAARIQHPNIIVVYELGEHEGMPYMAFEKLDGVDLEKAIEKGLRPDPRVLLNFILQVLAGLAHAHENGIVHRDIKPANIFVPTGLPAKIMDFGVARLAGHQVTTTSGVVSGTPNYMSPEQFQSKEIDGRSDLFSTGLILYELVTGEKAFRSNDIASLFYKIVHEEADLRLIPEGPEWEKLRLVLTRALAKKPDDRYADARAMSTDLIAALSDLGGSADLTAPADQILMVRPRPAASTAGAAEPTAAAGPRVAAPRPSPASSRRAPPRRSPSPAGSRTTLVLASVLGIGALGLLGFAGWLAFAPGGTPGPADSPPPVAPTPAASQTPPAPSPSATAATAREAAPATPPPATPAPVPTPTPTPTPDAAPAAPTPAPTPALTIEERLLRADELLASGHFRRAYDEAKSVQRDDPGNEQARVIAQDAELAMVVEEHIKNAREALDAGDRDTALREIREGGELAPNDRRLRELFEEAMRQ